MSRLVQPFLHLVDAGPDPLALAAELVTSWVGASLDVVGQYVVPPADGVPTRPFQTLHVDFGMPLVPVRPADVATYTALHVPRGAATEGATTRLVPLDGLLGQRLWPGRDELVSRFERYGRTHGAWDYAAGWIEGSLARLVEAADGLAVLPSVKDDPGFLCGLEFDSARAEEQHFTAVGLDVAAVAVDVVLAPGDLLVFDNHAMGHGRLGRRLPGELHQRFLGVRRAGVAEQLRMRDRLLDRFASPGSVGARVERCAVGTP